MINSSTATILGVLVPLILAFGGVVAWAGRRVLARIDHTSDALELVDKRLVAVETNQNWTMDTVQATDRNTRTAARKVGVMPRDLEKTVDRPHNQEQSA